MILSEDNLTVQDMFLKATNIIYIDGSEINRVFKISKEEREESWYVDWKLSILVSRAMKITNNCKNGNILWSDRKLIADIIKDKFIQYMELDMENGETIKHVLENKIIIHAVIKGEDAPDQLRILYSSKMNKIRRECVEKLIPTVVIDC